MQTLRVKVHHGTREALQNNFISLPNELAG